MMDPDVPMTKGQRTLDELRAEIDSIDEALHDLIVRRTEVVEEIAALKARENGAAPGTLATAMRPGREAQVIRHIVARHRGALPPAVIVRIWREIIAAKTRLQGPFELAVFGGDDPVGFFDVARAHYGSATPARLCDSPSAVIDIVRDRAGAVGVLPVPGGSATASNWWTAFATADSGPGPLIVARLPFLLCDANGPSGRGEREAVAIACVDREESGDDISLLIVRAATAASAGAVLRMAENAGLGGVVLDQGSTPGRRSAVLFLIEVPGYVGPEDARLASFAGALEEAEGSVCVIGGYARQIDLRTRSGAQAAVVR